MEQEPQKKPVVPGSPAAQQPLEPSTPALRPEDEAIVAERLRELGYID